MELDPSEYVHNCSFIHILDNEVKISARKKCFSIAGYIW